MIEFVIIMAIECRVVATLYVSNANRVRMCLATLAPYSTGVSVRGFFQVLRIVGTNAIRSIYTAITTDKVGSSLIIQGIRPISATAR